MLKQAAAVGEGYIMVWSCFYNARALYASLGIVTDFAVYKVLPFLVGANSSVCTQVVLYIRAFLGYIILSLA